MIKNRTTLLVFFLIFILMLTIGARFHPEKYYQDQWCEAHNGVTEYSLPDRTKIDCLTDEYAIEFDFANKWAEAIGQAIYYAAQTGKKTGIVIIAEQPERDAKYLLRLSIALEHIKPTVKIWVIPDIVRIEP